MKILPAIDILNGRCVRLTRGDYTKSKTYATDPLEVARLFEEAGLRHLHLVDLDGAREKHVVNHESLKRISEGTNLHIEFGGGIKSDRDLDIAFENGANEVICGSIAAKDPDTFLGWLERYGPEKIILGADAKEGKIAVDGWQNSTDLEVLTYIRDYVSKGIQKVICTDIAKDGMLEGPAYQLYRDLLNQIPELHLIASGGIRSTVEVERLREMGCQGAIIGKAIYEGKVKLNELATLC